MATIKDFLDNINGFTNAVSGAVKTLNMLAEVSFGTAKNFMQMEYLFKARLENDDLGSKVFEQVKKDAIQNGVDLSTYMNGALGNLSFSKNIDQLNEMNRLARQIATFDTTGTGLAGAFTTLREAMNGEVLSLSKQFNSAHVKDLKIADLGKQGDVDGFIKAFDKLLEMAGKSEEAMQKMSDAPQQKLDTLINKFQTLFAEAGTGAMTALLPLVDFLTNALDGEAFQVFMSVWATVLQGVASAFLWLISIVPPVWEVIQSAIGGVLIVIQNLLMFLWALAPYILGVAAAWGAYYLMMNSLTIGVWLYTTAHYVMTTVMSAAKAAVMALTSGVKALFMAMKANPIMFIISLIIGIITALLSFEVVTNGVRKVFSAAFGFIVDSAEWAVNAIVSLINGAINGINKVAKFFGDLLGVDAKMISNIEFKADFSKAKEAGQEFIENFSLEDLKNKLTFKDESEPKDYKDELLKWDFGAGGIGGIGSGAGTAFTIPSKIDEVGKVGQIGGTVDIASEDLKIMRELAEMKNIQNFVSLQPTVSVQTGDITNGYDIDTIVRRIEKSLEEQIATSAAGVYA
ncbi:hypothetical protein [Tumebacillus lipolyticus]|uniref:Phage tail tape measure protein n=1 Tax=Tumebacillus lipolyticus TaxID=1280370 RepID=A0ABW4ZWE4_9BACL